MMRCIAGMVRISFRDGRGFFLGGGILLLGCGEGGMWISLGSVGALIVGLEGRHRRGSIFVS